MMDDLKTRIAQLFKNDKIKMNMLLAVGLAGMLLLAISSWLPEKSAEVTAKTDVPAQDSTAYVQQTEARLEGLIENLQGAGKTYVMLTISAAEETVYALDSETEGERRQQTHVLLDGNDALVETINPPVIQGVAVLCEGGDDVTVQARITEIVSALTGIGTNKITVSKMA